MHRIRAGVALLLAVLLQGALVCGAARAASPSDDLGLRASINGRPLADYDGNSPLRLHPNREIVIHVDITNPGASPRDVRAVRLRGRVLGMTFFDYITRIDARIPAGATESREFSLDISDLGGQATGLLPASLEIVDAQRRELAGRPFVVNVRGSATSAYAIFGFLVAASTALLLVGALLRLAFGRLPAQRWYRATRFAVAGLGLGLSLTFTLSVLAVLVPNPDRWRAIVIVGGLLGLVVGFFTPNPPAEQAPARVIDLDAAAGQRVLVGAPDRLPEVTRPQADPLPEADPAHPVGS